MSAQSSELGTKPQELVERALAAAQSGECVVIADEGFYSFTDGQLVRPSGALPGRAAGGQPSGPSQLASQMQLDLCRPTATRPSVGSEVLQSPGVRGRSAVFLPMNRCCLLASPVFTLAVLAPPA